MRINHIASAAFAATTFLTAPTGAEEPATPPKLPIEGLVFVRSDMPKVLEDGRVQMTIDGDPLSWPQKLALKMPASRVAVVFDDKSVEGRQCPYIPNNGSDIFKPNIKRHFYIITASLKQHQINAMRQFGCAITDVPKESDVRTPEQPAPY